MNIDKTGYLNHLFVHALSHRLFDSTYNFQSLLPIVSEEGFFFCHCRFKNEISNATMLTSVLKNGIINQVGSKFITGGIMKFHLFGENNNKVMVLIHGVLTPWQIWQEHFEYFSQQYCVVVPALDGHIENEQSEFSSPDDEANKIIEFLKENFSGNIYALCGVSMGGAIAYKIFESGEINVEHLILDGAPLLPAGKIPAAFMERSYQSIIRKSKLRDKKTLDSFKKYFLPEKYLDSFLNFADKMSDRSVSNMVKGVCVMRICNNNSNNASILFMHGTSGNEILSRKSAKKLKAVYPRTEIRSFDGYSHGELAIYHPADWIKEVETFISAAE